jgi:TatD DNase family protein
MIEYIDIHSHLNFPQFNPDREELIAKMHEKGIATITVGTGLETSREAVELASRHPHLFATVGIHPAHAHEETFDEATFGALLTEKVVAVGECGLDYYRMRTDADVTQTDAEKDVQRKIFIAHIEFAKKHGLPLMLHCRASKGTMDAYEEALDILETYNKQQTTNNELQGNFHFFAGDLATAKRAVDAGFTLSFDGPVTFTSDYDDVIRFVPEDMIMAETDAPYAAPVPHRGKRNEPLFVPHIVKRLAAIRGVDTEAFRAQLLTNAQHSFPKLSFGAEA